MAGAKPAPLADKSAWCKLRAGIFGGRNDSRLMPDWPTEEITDQDPRYRELLAQEAEARLRFLASDLAREEMAKLAELAKQKTGKLSWKLAPKFPSQRQRVFKWD